MEIKDQTNRKQAIALLKLSCAQNDLRIQSMELTLTQMREKQINRRAELRMQQLLLKHAEDKAAYLTKQKPPTE